MSGRSRRTTSFRRIGPRSRAPTTLPGLPSPIPGDSPRQWLPSRRRSTTISSTTARCSSRSRSTRASPDGSGLMRTYKVKSGDTLTGIAKQFGVSMMTALVGERPQGEGRPRTSARSSRSRRSAASSSGQGRATRSTGLAAKYKVDRSRHHRDQRDRPTQPRRRPGADRCPGAKGDGDRDAEAASRRASKRDRSRQQRSQRGGTAHPPRTYYGGGKFRWPTQRATTSASTSTTATTRSTSTATPATRSGRPPAGTVIFAGWKNNGGGYQVWIAHGSGLYTTYNHMSSVVGRARPARRPRPARGADGRDRLRDGLAPPLRGLEGPDLERRPPRQPARLPLGRTPAPPV